MTLYLVESDEEFEPGDFIDADEILRGEEHISTLGYGGFPIKVLAKVEEGPCD